MADAKLTALTAASALAAADLFYVSQSAASRKATGTQLLALVGTAYVPLAGGTMTGALTLPAGAVGTPALTFTSSATNTGIYTSSANVFAIAISGVRRMFVDANELYSPNITSYFIGSVNQAIDPTFVAYPGNEMLFKTNGAVRAKFTNAGDFQVYKLNTDASNYERLTLTGTAGSNVEIKAETLGTGGDNLDIVLTPAGTGNLKFGTHTASADQAVSGYITIKDAGGTTRKLAVIT